MKKKQEYQKQKLKRWKGCPLLLALMLCCMVFLSGCRQSPALEQVMYTMDASEVDWDEEQLDPEDEGEEDERFSNEVTEDAETQRDTENQLAVADGNAPPSPGTQSVTIKYGAGGNNNYQAEDKPSKTNKEEEVDGNTTGIQDTDEPDPNGEGENNNEQDNDVEDEGEGEGDGEGEDPNNPELTPSDDQGLKKKVVDETGKEVTMPEDVHMVTAVGPAAQMVEMLGGSGKLFASNADFTGNSLAAAVFSDISSIQTLWGGSGKSPLGSGEFAQILEAKPDVCFELSGDNTFSAEQIAQLEEAGITYFVLPALSSADSLKTAVRKVAEVLETNENTGGSASQIAESYCSWVDSVISDVSAQNGNTVLSSVYIAEWRDDISYTLTGSEGLPAEAGLAGGTTGSGVAIGWSKSKPELVSTFMGAAGVTNESASSDSYSQTQGIYIVPMARQFAPVFSSGEYAFYSGGVGAGYDLFLCRELAPGSYQMLGSTMYPAIVVANETIKSRIESNWFWQYHGGAQKDGINWASGYVDANGTLIYGSICGPYSIFVNPSGIGDWAQGSLESPLEAYWAAYKFSGQYSLDALYSQVAAFYQNYFQASLTNDQIRAMLKE